MARIEAGSYKPLYKQADDVSEIAVEPFYLDRYQVSNQQFINFTNEHDKWSKAKIKPIFADPTYLQQFDHANVKEIAQQPVVNVSWFAASAYCNAQGKRLPSLDEWEYAARAGPTKIDGTSDIEFRELILQWYSKPVTEALLDVTAAEANYWGVHGMHGVVWEIVRDFNTALVTGESRGDSSLDKQLFCGAGAAASVDPSDYAAFMRYALRSSYSSSYTLNSLGFRCAKDIEPSNPQKL
jgi:formylglycine-generating enzyme required for sulfatase activity